MNILKQILIKIMSNALIIKGRKDIADLRRNSLHPKEVNERLLMRTIRRNRNTEFGRKYGFADISSPEEYKKRVPVLSYADYEAYVERIYFKNERNLLTRDKVVGFARSSGSIGKPKFIPKTARDVNNYTKYTVTRFLALADEYKMKTEGRHLKGARGINGLPRFDALSPYGLPATNVADIPAKKLYFIYPYILVLPLRRQFSGEEIEDKYAISRFGLEDRNALFLFSVFAKTVLEIIEYIRDNWQMLVRDIETGTIDPSVYVRDDVKKELAKVLRADPARAAEIRRECEKGFDETILHRLWPNMAVIDTIGTSAAFSGFMNRVKAHADGIGLDYSIYGASEGLMAAAFEINNPGQLLLSDSCYYEFADPEAEDYSHTVGIEELEAGKDYEVILTNQSGFYRYAIRDVIRCMGHYNKLPVINFNYRKGQLINLVGEKTDMEQMNEVMCRLEKQTGIEIREWAITGDKAGARFRYMLLAETAEDRDISGYSELLEELLASVNAQYAFYAQQACLLDRAVIRNQIPGTHETWMEKKIAAGASRTQYKPVKMLDTEEKKDFFLARIRQR